MLTTDLMPRENTPSRLVVSTFGFLQSIQPLPCPYLRAVAPD